MTEFIIHSDAPANEIEDVRIALMEMLDGWGDATLVNVRDLPPEQLTIGGFTPR